MRLYTRSAVSALALSLFALPVLAQGSYPTPNGDRVDANGMPTTHSTPAEHAQTEDLNKQIQQNNAAADAQAQQQKAAMDAQGAANAAQSDANQAQYQQQRRQYQNQLQRNQAAQQNYEDRSAAYNALRGRYAAERAAYHRGVWPSRFREWHLQNDAHLVGSRVEIIDGGRVGTVDSVARAPGGGVAALYVTLDNGKQVWIDDADIRFDRAAGVVMTDLDSGDLHRMADERM